MEPVGRFLQIPPQSCFLFGARGTGKSTLVRERLPDALLLDLLEPGLRRSLAARPQRLREILADEPGERTVVIDEIQRVPELLPVVRAAMADGAADRRFVLTVSSARLLRRRDADLLGGPAACCTVHPFMASELRAFDLERALALGLLPVVLGAADPKATLHAYATAYVDQDVRRDRLTRNADNFARFLKTVSFSHASRLNLAEIARETALDRKVVKRYLGILEDLLLAFRLPVFRARADRKTVVHEKLYLFDVGLFRSLRPRGPLDRPEEIGGRALEGLVAQHLRAWAAYSRHDASVHFWRTQGGTEVDFVVYGDAGLQAFEVRNSRRVFRRDLRSLRIFKDDYPEAETAILYGGRERLRIDDTPCIPVGEFLRSVVPDRGLLTGFRAR